MSVRPVGYRGKRAFDLAILLATSPLTVPLGLATAIFIKLTEGGPALFRQERAGLNGNPFHVLKFRTMNEDSDTYGQLLPDRDRLTTLGRILRLTSLDEIPQLINVLRGEMSIVGPRPLYTRYLPHYSPREHTRHEALPGITGLAQVNGRNNSGWRDRLELDAQYVERNSVRLDVWICYQTALKAIRSDGVSVIAGDTGDPLDVERAFCGKDGLCLRRLYTRDLPLRVKWMNDERVRRHMTLPEDVTLNSTHEWFLSNQEDPNRHEFCLEDVHGRVVAMSGLRAEPGGRSSEFYVFVDPERHGEGYGRIATEMTIRRAREIDSIQAVTLTVARGNDKAVKIYRSLGFLESASNEDRIWMTLPLEENYVVG